MSALIYLAATANLIAAAFDCHSTIKHLSPNTELNPLASRLMKRLGMRPAVYLCYAVIVSVTLSVSAACLVAEASPMTALCALALLLEATLHGMAAHVNTTGRFNRWTGFMLAPVVRVYSAWDRIWSRRGNKGER